MTETWEKFDQMPGFRRWLDRVEEEIHRETRIDVSQVGDWFGGEVSAALFDVDVDGGRVEGAITVAVRDRMRRPSSWRNGWSTWGPNIRPRSSGKVSTGTGPGWGRMVNSSMR